MHTQNLVLNTALLFTSKQNCLTEAHCGIQGYNMTLSNTAHATSVPAHCRWDPFEFHNILMKV
jgi:hypothetical protein